MRHTSFRRRSGLRIIGKIGDTPRSLSEQCDVTLPDDDESGIDCAVCGAHVKILANGRPAAHAAGGVRTNTRKGLYKCAGSGRE